MSYKNIYLQVPQPVLIEHAPNVRGFDKDISKR